MCDTCTEMNVQCDVLGLLSVRDDQWRVDELKAGTKVTLECIIEEIWTAVMGNIKMVVQMLFDKHNNILNVFFTCSQLLVRWYGNHCGGMGTSAMVWEPVRCVNKFMSFGITSCVYGCEYGLALCAV
jgi:hypothetical protein